MGKGPEGIRALASMGIASVTVLDGAKEKPKENLRNTLNMEGGAANFLAATGLDPTTYLARFKENSWQLGATLMVFQVIFIVLFGVCCGYSTDWHDYEHEVLAHRAKCSPIGCNAGITSRDSPTWHTDYNVTKNTDPTGAIHCKECDDMAHHIEDIVTKADTDLTRMYPWFQDTHVMIIVGFGFLMTFLKRYSWSSLGFNFMFTAFTIQWSILVHGWFFKAPITEGSTEFMHVDIGAMLEADFTSGSILIAFGAVLGVASPVQLLVMIILQTVFYNLNAWICINCFNISDIGGSLIIHAFGAYFGLAAARCLFKKGQIDNPAEGGEYHSDIFSLIGTVFLWMYWPSFNSAPGAGMDRHLAVTNTYLALCGSCLATYFTSIWATPGRRITMEHVQNATLAGGVAMGTSASMPVAPFGALIIGGVAGVLSVCGYSYIKPALANAINLHDTCGVHNLHGMPAILAAVASVIRCASGYYIDPFTSAQQMALSQLACLGITLGIAIGGGIITGMVMNIPLWEQLDHEEYFEDGKYWELDVYQVPTDEDD